MFLGLDYHDQYFTAGVGAELLSLKFRDKTDEGYKVDEGLTTISAEAHVKYKKDNFLIAAKSFLTSNMTMLNTLGGYLMYAAPFLEINSVFQQESVKCAKLTAKLVCVVYW